MVNRVPPETLLSSLTDKQRAVLDLLVEHKSSKEIARILGISPYTVDQRIMASRQKLGVSSRGEAARTYGQLLELCGKPAYRYPYVAIMDEDDQPAGQDSHLDPVFALSDVTTINVAPPWQAHSDRGAGLEAIDRRFGIFGRVFAVFGLAAFIAMMFLAMVAIAETLTKIS